MNMVSRFLWMPALLFAVAGASAQTVAGTVSDCDGGTAMAGVSVRIAGASVGDVTDRNGRYTIGNIPEGVCTLEFSFVGMRTVRREAKAERGTRTTLNVCLHGATSELDEVLVEARHERREVTEARRQGVPVSVIDGKLLAGRGTTIAEVINHQTGVKVRRTGGAGSDTKINVRGLEGNRVQIYLDGKPLNTPDGSFSINDIPL